MDVSEAEYRLNVLLTRNYDAEKGFERAEKEVKNPKLKDFFKRNYKKRNQFVKEIKEMIKSIGGDPNRGSSLIAGAHRVWMNLKELFTNNTEKAIIKECIRGEKLTIKEYEKATSSTAIRKEFREQLQEHLEYITQSKEEMQGMKIAVAS